MLQEESEASVSPVKKDLEKKLSDYDYLVGMAILKLSEEEKDKLLHDSELKLEELKVCTFFLIYHFLKFVFSSLLYSYLILSFRRYNQ